MKGYRLAHTCTICDAGMKEGYVVDGGLEYYCSRACLNVVITDEEWTDMSEYSEYNYYTTWEDFNDLYEKIESEN
jgi:hypothetical protein